MEDTVEGWEKMYLYLWDFVEEDVFVFVRYYQGKRISICMTSLENDEQTWFYRSIFSLQPRDGRFPSFWAISLAPIFERAVLWGWFSGLWGVGCHQMSPFHYRVWEESWQRSRALTCCAITVRGWGVLWGGSLSWEGGCVVGSHGSNSLLNMP